MATSFRNSQKRRSAASRKLSAVQLKKDLNPIPKCLDAIERSYDARLAQGFSASLYEE